MLGLTPRRVTVIAAALVVIYLGQQYVPPYFRRFQFGDDVRQTVKYAAANRKNLDAVRREILQLAEEDGVPLTPQDIRFTQRGPSFTVDINYTWPIDLKLKKYNLPFHISESGEVFEK
jgi:hypothetical protein